jgi:hypothetical protein
MIRTQWLKEVKNLKTGEDMYRISYPEFTWLHGKAFRRAFLTEKDIRFHKNLRTHEDFYFYTIISLKKAAIFDCDFCAYIWKLNKHSVTRRYGREFYADLVNYPKSWAQENNRDYLANAKTALMALIKKYESYYKTIPYGLFFFCWDGVWRKL